MEVELEELTSRGLISRYCAPSVAVISCPVRCLVIRGYWQKTPEEDAVNLPERAPGPCGSRPAGSPPPFIRTAVSRIPCP
ncbi:hypothetical protein LX32DRAFT_640759 [Colletotrichum zoysiae]|uniref:Uncharacterized protein n=1 Tax=Colletotrichum zoysiae TaxID=1216348 RepID=A0AAD9HG50_9PEZI|nr:hypothetical protein LX32DRAFT_640759 [Colletotrichum zoysiae]